MAEAATAAGAEAVQEPLQFQPFASQVDVGFWQELEQRKLGTLMLSEEALTIAASYTLAGAPGTPSRLLVTRESFSGLRSLPMHINVPGTLINTNTIEGFKALDKKALLAEAAAALTASVLDGAALQRPQLLGQFLLLTHADLKQYKFYYWFAFPALVVPNWSVRARVPVPLRGVFSSAELALLLDHARSSTMAVPDAAPASTQPQAAAFVVVHDSESGDTNILPLTQLAEAVRTTTQATSRVYVAFSDPCSLPQHPGWPLRNLLVLLRHTLPASVTTISVICLRPTPPGAAANPSILLACDLPPLPQPLTSAPPCVGWELNVRGRPGPRLADLRTHMDPSSLARSAVALNLKLMRWRVFPQLDTERLAATRCLLLGAGTLGCNVARTLLGWGVRSITFVDNGTVSFSNPVRQSLFTYQDSLNGGAPKATAAAAALRAIFPDVNADGVVMAVPMPGHRVTAGSAEEAATREAVARLEHLVDEHDIVFLLTDSRESRWLPTLLCAAKDKPAITVALGFDSYVVMRHGVTGPQRQPRCLGCYFCNDVVAPTDSLSDRTLDQQCTVTRPGLSSIASSLGVELVVALLHHPDGFRAAAPSVTPRGVVEPTGASSPLGSVPHTLRGFLANYSMLTIHGASFDKCTACSPALVDVYNRDGFDFLVKAFNTPSILESITGLDDLRRATDALDVDWDVDDDDFEVDEDGADLG